MVTHRSARPTAKAISFFYRHARYSFVAGRESRAEGRRRNARALARAEAEASARGWRTEWVSDPDGEEESLGAVLRDEDGHTIASAWGVIKPSQKARRVVEAELALEALS